MAKGLDTSHAEEKRKFPIALAAIIHKLPDMDFSKWQQMDAHLLVGLLNTELRNHSESLDDLVKTHHLPEAELEQKMRSAGYEYRAEQNQFR